MFKLLLLFLKFRWQTAWARQQALMRPPEHLPSRWDGVSEESHRAGHEVSDARPAWLLLCLGGLFGTIVMVMVIISWLQGAVRENHAAPVATKFEQSFQHAPRAETDIAGNWDQINRETKARLETYRWIDRAHAVTAIPIARAMELIATEGLPARTGTTPAFPPPDQEMRPLSRTESVHDVTSSY